MRIKFMKKLCVFARVEKINYECRLQKNKIIRRTHLKIEISKK